MTEYTTSSRALREHMTTRQRTAFWVQSHSPEGNEFLSPSIPPSVLSDISYEAPSETESTRSLPPKMVLRYGGGQPDVPIPREDPRARYRHQRNDSLSSGSRTTSPPLIPISTHQADRYRARSGSHGSSPLARPPPPRSPLAPEEIRVLPSQSHPSSTSSHQPRSQSLPRTTDLPSAAPSFPGPMHALHGPAGDSEGTQTWHSYSRGRSHQSRKQPPAIIYAPSHSSSRPHYAPPAMFHHPPPVGPDGILYSHSAPVQMPSRHKDTGNLPTTMVPPSHTLALLHQEERRAGTWSGRKRERPRLPPLLGRSPSSSSLNSQGSGSTYYVLPSAGQKVHVIPPSPSVSIATATSITRSPTSPRSLGPMRKAPFFQRLLSFAGRIASVKSSIASGKTPSSGGRRKRLQRRHSTGGAGAPRSQPNYH